MKHNIFIIAEAGVNHNGDLEVARKLIDAAKDAGADAVKFQTFNADKLVTKKAKKANYQEQNDGDGSQYQMLKKLELSYDDFKVLKEYSDQKGICFMSTAFDLESIDFIESLNVNIHKIPSGEITNLPYLEKLAKTGKELILSTGMCDVNDVRAALHVLQTYNNRITILHCTTEYPTPFKDVNLNAMVTMKKEFHLPVGYSDHTKGIEVCIAAAAMGATVLEKHFTLDRNMEGPDHKASLEPHELKELVTSVRNIETALGTGKKEISESEIKNKSIARKSIIASKNIKKGEVLSEENLTVKRPGNGISPMLWFDVLGTKAIQNFEKDDFIVI